MSQLFNRHSVSVNDDSSHSISGGTAFSLQSFVDDIPFDFNPKYRTVVVPNANIPEYDATKIQNILSRSFDFTLENKVLLEALEEVKRKKKKIEEDKQRHQLPPMPTVTPTSCQPVNAVPTASNALAEHISFSGTLPPTLSQPIAVVAPHPKVPLPVVLPSYPMAPVGPSAVNQFSTATAYRLPSVRDIYWPTGNQQQYTVPVSSSSTLPPNVLNLPAPMHLASSLPSSVKPNNQSFNSCDSVATNELAATFDGTLGSDDPFHDAELKSLNDVAELRHLYSNFSSASTVPR